MSDINVLVRRMEPITAKPQERDAVEELSAFLDRAASEAEGDASCALIGPDGARTEVPPTVFHVLERVADVMAQGGSITVVPTEQLLSTQQAANMLNLSRQYLTRIIDAGEIPHVKVGKRHRRLRVGDVLAFRGERQKKRRHALRELTELSQEYGGYEELRGR